MQDTVTGYRIVLALTRLGRRPASMPPMPAPKIISATSLHAY